MTRNFLFSRSGIQLRSTSHQELAIAVFHDNIVNRQRYVFHFPVTSAPTGTVKSFAIEIVRPMFSKSLCFGIVSINADIIDPLSNRTISKFCTRIFASPASALGSPQVKAQGLFLCHELNLALSHSENIATDFYTINFPGNVFRSPHEGKQVEVFVIFGFFLPSSGKRVIRLDCQTPGFVPRTSMSISFHGSSPSM